MTRSISDKTFILGIGAQKTGSTWLFDYFRTHPEVFVSSLKEMHYFDEIFRPDLCTGFGNRFAHSFFSQLAGRQNGDTPAGKVDFADLGDRVKMNLHGDSAYVDFFRKRVPAGIEYFCEITPSYSMLREDGFRAIKRLFPRTKVIFVMRDPIDRHYSMLRMAARNRGRSDDEHTFLHLLDTPDTHERGRYDLTIGSLLKVFDAQDLFFGFYETLFNEQEIKRLTDFLGVDYLPPDFARRVNAGHPGRPLSKREVDAALETYRPVYEFCADFFGSQLPGSWRSA